ncbi:MAG: GH92 family glycosyl hydrolase [Myxococcota bacterium]
MLTRWFLVIGALLVTGCGDDASAEPDGGLDAAFDGAGDDASLSGDLQRDAAQEQDVEPPPPSIEASAPFSDWVDPFLGTGGVGFNDIGSAFPGPQTPFGMVRPGPDTMTDAGAAAFLHCSGYANGDRYIRAFSHTRMHGTGIADYGHIGVMPRAPVDPLSEEPFAHRSEYENEVAETGYYAVTLTEPNVRVELSARAHTAVHRYTFTEGERQSVLFDMAHELATNTIDAREGAITLDAEGGEVRGRARIAGGYSSRFGGAEVFFVARFSRSWSVGGVWSPEGLQPGETTREGAGVGGWVEFDPAEGSSIVMELAISFVSTDGARANLEAESLDFDFDAARAAATSEWESILGRVQIAARRESDFVRFYTALYHSLLMPTLTSDVDGRYRSVDDEVRTANFAYYSDFSLWDTYRTLHPLIALLLPDVQQDMLRSLTQMAIDGGAMPRWPLGPGYTGGMIGDPAAIVMAESIAKGIDDFDLRAAYDAMERASQGPASELFGGRGHAEEYERLGFVPMDATSWSTAKTLEFAYADSALANIAGELGEDADAETFATRAERWRNTYDSERGFFVGRNEGGSFDPEFSEGRWQEYYAEGNAWQYLWLVPQDPDGLAEVLGGREAALERLRFFFEESTREVRTPLPPRWYWHGNEPDIHASFLFALWGRPDETARWSRWVAENNYGEGPRGLPGNDDSGTMSAWLVFDMLGFFPIAGSDEYVLGSPIVTAANIDLASGPLRIEAPESSVSNVVVTRILGDGAPIEGPTIQHERLLTTRELLFEF